MNNQFDELTKSLARSVTRRAALKKFGLGLVAFTAAALGMRSATAAPKRQAYCEVTGDFVSGAQRYTGRCVDPATCQIGASSQCSGKVSRTGVRDNPCEAFGLLWIDTKQGCSF